MALLFVFGKDGSRRATVHRCKRLKTDVLSPHIKLRTSTLTRDLLGQSLFQTCDVLKTAVDTCLK
jgi:hypothetical protein